jgi:hypothetical protein
MGTENGINLTNVQIYLIFLFVYVSPSLQFGFPKKAIVSFEIKPGLA